MWRFKPSKYKNAVPKVPKKGEGWITDISVGNPHSSGNHIKASAAFLAFNTDSAGIGNLGLLSLNDTGSKNKNLPLLKAHSEFVTDFDFCPYDDGILATGSQDLHVKLWRISEDTLKSNIPCNPEADILLEHKLEVLKFNPQADCILATVEDNQIGLWDVNMKQSVYVNSNHEDVVQCISWRQTGDLLASTGKDKKLRIWDPRNPDKTQVAASHSNNRDSRVVWVGDTDQLITTGFGSGREREVFLRDIRKLEDPVASHTGDSSLGVFIPLFDPDTNMLFLVAKADTTVSFWEVLDRVPFFQEASKYLGEVQAKGAALVPKRALEVMDGEVNRLLILGQDCIVPISFQVPRKSYRDFHADLFPDTYAPDPCLTFARWQAEEEVKVRKISLEPSKMKGSLLKFNHHLGSGPKKESPRLEKKNPISPANQDDGKKDLDSNSKQTKEQRNSDLALHPVSEKKPSVPMKLKIPVANDTSDLKPQPVSPKPLRHLNIAPCFESKPAEAQKPAQSPTPKRPARSFGMRVSKFRHLNGTIFPKETHITDLASLTRTVPGECNGFDVNEKFVAIPIGAAGNFLALLKLSNAGRAPSAADMPGVLCGTSVMDFCWDPFDSFRLVTACDTGDIQVWNITEGASTRFETPSLLFKAHSEKVNIVKFHPCAKDVLCTASSDLSVRIWDLTSQEEKIRLSGHSDQILNLAWSPNGKFLASVCKDQKVRIFEPRASPEPIKIGSGPQGTRGARIVWVLNGSYIVVSGFSKVSERQLYLYDVNDISNPIGDIGLDVSPATLIPYYDQDSSTLFLTAKGDSMIFAYEVATDSPYFHPLSHYKCNSPHQALSFLPKLVCNVREVEFARAVRLTPSTIEPISFLVPRLRSEYFQDDLFPDTTVTWKPTLSSAEWFSGVDKPLQTISLQPTNMALLSEAPAPSNKHSNVIPTEMIFEGEVALESSLSFLQNSKEKEKMIVQSMKSQCQLQQDSLPQEAFEGVDPKEWEEEEENHLRQNLRSGVSTR